MDFEEYLKENRLTVKEFSQKYDLDYYCLARVKKGRFTRNQEINNVFEMLGIEYILERRVDADMSFLTQESICIQHERKGDIYCYTEFQLQEIEEYLTNHQIAYYVRNFKDYWKIKYDRGHRDDK